MAIIKTSLVTQTVLHAVHRLHGVFDFHRVVVVEEGRVVEVGQPLQLYNEEGSFFRRLYDAYIENLLPEGGNVGPFLPT